MAIFKPGIPNALYYQLGTKGCSTTAYSCHWNVCHRRTRYLYSSKTIANALILIAINVLVYLTKTTNSTVSVFSGLRTADGPLNEFQGASLIICLAFKTFEIIKMLTMGHLHVYMYPPFKGPSELI